MMGTERMGKELRTKQAKIENQKRTIKRQQSEIEELEADGQRLRTELTTAARLLNFVALWGYKNQIDPRVVGDLHRISRSAHETANPVPWEPYEIESMEHHTWPTEEDE